MGQTEDNEPGLIDRAKNALGMDTDTDQEKSGAEQVFDSPADQQPDMATSGGAVRDPKDWKTGDDPATDAEKSHLRTMYAEAGRPMPANIETMSKAEAAIAIGEIRKARGLDPQVDDTSGD